MASKARSKGKVIARVGYLDIRQVAKVDKGTTIVIMHGKKVLKTGLKNKETAMDEALKLL